MFAFDGLKLFANSLDRSGYLRSRSKNTIAQLFVLPIFLLRVHGQLDENLKTHSKNEFKNSLKKKHLLTV